MNQKLVAIILTILFAVLNVSTAAHADCLAGESSSHTLEVVELADNQESEHDKACDSCICAHSHHSHTVLMDVQSNDVAVSLKASHAWKQAFAFSYQHSPPARPPKA